MAKEKQHVFSARTTEEGLRALNEVKERLKVSWDELVIDAVSAHYGLDRAVMTLPKKEVPSKPVKGEVEQPPAEETVTEQPEATEQGQPEFQHQRSNHQISIRPTVSMAGSHQFSLLAIC